MKEYSIKVGETFTEQKAKELKEYLEAKDKECSCQYEELKKVIPNGITHNKKCPLYKELTRWIKNDYGNGICAEDRIIILKKLKYEKI